MKRWFNYWYKRFLVRRRKSRQQDEWREWAKRNGCPLL
ncbi:hypothetical protein SIA3lw_00175 [Salmonella phage vB_SalS-SIA3lw]